MCRPRVLNCVVAQRIPAGQVGQALARGTAARIFTGGASAGRAPTRW